MISPNPTTGATINDNELASFLEGILRAGQLESTCDDCADVTDGSPVIGLGELDPVFPQFHTNSNGLGARHNADQCFACHAQPVLGGSGGFIVPNPGDKTPQPAENPQFRWCPSVREAERGPDTLSISLDLSGKCVSNASPTALPMVESINCGRCAAARTIPRFPTALSPSLISQRRRKQATLAFRIPLQMMGLGLIESIQDREILAQHDATAALRGPFGITGHPNRSGNDGTITRFGWKAQNKSITIFAGEAYNVEMGITNEAFPTATEEDADCQGPDKPEPNDVVRTDRDRG